MILRNSHPIFCKNIKVCIYLWPDLWAQHALGKMRWWFGVILMIMIIIGLADVDDDIKLVCTYLESNHFGSKILRACNPQLLISWRILTQLDLLLFVQSEQIHFLIWTNTVCNTVISGSILTHFNLLFCNQLSKKI